MKIKVISKKLKKSVPYIMLLQKKFGLPVCKNYPLGYVVLLRKLTYLSIYSVPDRDIKLLLEKERALLELLNVDSLHITDLWFESQCKMDAGPNRLLLSGHDLGHPVDTNMIQVGLDFKQRDKELFGSVEMGVDVLRELKEYYRVYHRIQKRVIEERAVVRAAQNWVF